MCPHAQVSGPWPTSLRRDRDGGLVVIEERPAQGPPSRSSIKLLKLLPAIKASNCAPSSLRFCRAQRHQALSHAHPKHRRGPRRLWARHLTSQPLRSPCRLRLLHPRLQVMDLPMQALVLCHHHHHHLHSRHAVVRRLLITSAWHPTDLALRTRQQSSFGHWRQLPWWSWRMDHSAHRPEQRSPRPSHHRRPQWPIGNFSRIGGSDLGLIDWSCTSSLAFSDNEGFLRAASSRSCPRPRPPEELSTLYMLIPPGKSWRWAHNLCGATPHLFLLDAANGLRHPVL